MIKISLCADFLLKKMSKIQKLLEAIHILSFAIEIQNQLYSSILKKVTMYNETERFYYYSC